MTHFPGVDDYVPSAKNTSPATILLLTGRCKYGYRTHSGGAWINYSLANAFALKGRSKKNQMRAIVKAFGLNLEWVRDSNWRIRKSGNLHYHPATYTLTIGNL